MHASRFLLAIAIASVAPGISAGEGRHYLQLVNRAKDSVASLSVAEAGTDAYTELPLGEPLRGGGVSTTIQVAGEGCDYDFRFVFRDGRALQYHGVDVCRTSVLRIRALPLRSGGARLANSQGR